MKKKNLLILVCILTIALVTAACGSSEDKRIRALRDR